MNQLQNHADKAGCRLIINPDYAFQGRTSLAAKTRLKTFIEFLERMPDPLVVVAIQNKMTNIESLTMVGDWFLAESVSFKENDGFTNTFFTRNASEINKRIDDFESELKELLEDYGWTEENSRKNTLEYLQKLVQDIT